MRDELGNALGVDFQGGPRVGRQPRDGWADAMTFRDARLLILDSA
jgi:hypothetical protein